MGTHKINADIDVSGEVQGTSLDINGAADISGDVVGGANAIFTGDLTVTGTDIRTGASNGLDLGDDSSIITLGRTNEMWTQQDVDADATLYVNYRGYNAASTRFRSFDIRDGKAGQIALFNGTDKSTTFGGSVTTGGAVNVNNAGADKKMSFDRTGGKGISIEHDSSGIYFYNETDSSVMFRMYNAGNIQTSGEVEGGSLDINGNAVISSAGVSLANQPAIPLLVDNAGGGVDGRVFINVKHNDCSTAAALGAGLQMQAGAVTSGTASYFSSQIFLQAAAAGNHTVHSAPKGYKFYVDNHDTAAGAGASYTAFGDLAFELFESGIGKAYGEFQVAGNLNCLNGQIELGGTGRITGIDTVSADTDAASKTYVDSAVSSAGGGDVTLSGTQTFTGVKTFGTTTKLQFRDSAAYINSPTANDIEVAATTITLDASSDIQLEGNTTVTGSITADQINLQDGGDYITFYGNDAGQHSISSRDASGTAGQDDLRINSYAAVHINLDSNSNNGSNADFTIGHHGDNDGAITQLFTVDGENGNVTLTGIILDGNTITGIDNASEFTDNDAHIMTSTAIKNKIADNDNSFLTSVPNHSGNLITSGTVAADRVATLNQNTTGSAGTVSSIGTLTGQ